jgi:hypothetical protein
VNDPTVVEILKFVQESVESENDPYDYPPDYVCPDAVFLFGI